MQPSQNGSNGLNELDRCHTCQHTRLWHDNNKPIHPFNNGETGATAFLKRKDQRGAPEVTQIAQRGMPFDPVLRQTLINKGVISVDDLRAAEEQIRAVTVQFLGGANGQSTEEVRGR